MRKAVITGASTGIGKITAMKLAKNDYHTILIARSIDKLSRIKEKIEIDGGKADFYKVDLSDAKEVIEFIKKLSKEHKEIDTVLNIAGIWHDKEKIFAETDFEEFSTETVLNTYSVGFTAPTLLIHGLIPLMPKGSHIINLSGTFENGSKGWLPYYSSKKALEALTYGLSEELRDKNIYVNGVSPSDTATEEYKKWFPEYIEDAIEPDEIAELIVEILKTNKSGTIQVIKKYDYTEKDVDYLKLAIEMSKRSHKNGAFPAGAVIVKDNKILSKTTSATFPKINFHAGSKAIDQVISDKNEQLSDYILYASMEPCLMCLSRAYWAGIRRIVYAIKKESVPYELCYESNHNHYSLLERFNEKMNLIHIKDLELSAMKNVNDWLKNNN